jgi:transcriptional regulator with XRE-family HTH domain
MIIKLSERLRLIRNNKGLTQKTLARLLNIAEQTLNKYEKGHRVPDARILNQMVNVLECDDPGWLLTGRESERTPAASETLLPYNVSEEHRTLTEILASGDEMTIEAIKSNLSAFRDSIREKSRLNSRIDKLEQDVRKLKKGRPSTPGINTPAVQPDSEKKAM